MLKTTDGKSLVTMDTSDPDRFSGTVTPNILGSATNSNTEVEESEKSDGAWSESSDDSDDDKSLQTQKCFLYIVVNV